MCSHRINPTKMTDQDACWLRGLLDADRNQRNARVWFPCGSSSWRYRGKYAYSMQGGSTIDIELTHEIVHYHYFNTVTGQQEDRYIVYSPRKAVVHSKGDAYHDEHRKGVSGTVYDVVGVLIPYDDRLLFKKNHNQVVKVQPYLDPASLGGTASGHSPSSVSDKAKAKDVTEAVDDVGNQQGEIDEPPPSRADIEQESSVSVKMPHLEASPVVFSEEEHTSYLILKKIQQMNLKQLLDEGGPASVYQRLLLTYNILKALKHQVHDHGVIHRDIKPQNMMVDNQLNVNIIDFGFSIFNDSQVCKGKNPGTQGFAAPEVYNGQYDIKTDIYAEGMVLGLVWGGKISDNNSTLVNLFADIPDIGSLPSGMEGEIRALIMALKSHHPSDRPDLDTAIKQVDNMLLSMRLKKPGTPPACRSSIIDAHAVAIKTANTLRNVTKLSEVASTVKQSLHNIDNEFSLLEFLDVLGVKGEYSIKSKSVLADQIDATVSDYIRINEDIDTLILNMQIKANAMLQTEKAEMLYMYYDLVELKSELINNEANFSEWRTVLTKVSEMHLSLSRSYDEFVKVFNDKRASKYILDTRLSKYSEASTVDDLLQKHKNSIVASINKYLKETSAKSVMTYSHVPADKRWVNIHNMLDAVDYAQNVDQLGRLVNTELSTLPTGYWGKSQLRDLVTEALQTVGAASLGVAQSC